MNFEARHWEKSSSLHILDQRLNQLLVDTIDFRISFVQLIIDAVLLVLQPQVDRHAPLFLRCDEHADEVYELLTI